MIDKHGKLPRFDDPNYLAKRKAKLELIVKGKKSESAELDGFDKLIYDAAYLGKSGPLQDYIKGARRLTLVERYEIAELIGRVIPTRGRPTGSKRKLPDFDREQHRAAAAVLAKMKTWREQSGLKNVPEDNRDEMISQEIKNNVVLASSPTVAEQAIKALVRAPARIRQQRNRNS